MHGMLKNLSAAAPPAPPPLGALMKRPAALMRGEGELLAVLHRYLDNSISTSDKRKRCTEERDILAVKEDITREVVGRSADPALGRDEIKPSLVKSFELVRSEVGNWRTKHPDKVQLYKDKHARMEQVR